MATAAAVVVLAATATLGVEAMVVAERAEEVRPAVADKGREGAAAEAVAWEGAWAAVAAAVARAELAVARAAQAAWVALVA